MLTADCVSAFLNVKNPFAGARNPRGIAQLPADGVWAGEQAENCAGRGSARGEWVLPPRPPVSPERHASAKTCLKRLRLDGSHSRLWLLTFYSRRVITFIKLAVCVLNVLLSSWVRYEEGAPDTSRRDQDVGWSDSKKTEEWVLTDNAGTVRFSLWLFVLFTLVSFLSTGIESKKGEEDGKYIPINVRMQRTQVDSLFFCRLNFQTNINSCSCMKPFSSTNNASKCLKLVQSHLIFRLYLLFIWKENLCVM